ncbi:MAG TPA: cupin domain-containing protein [Puia sp.]|nr:cupin domain-containing protein [Puia sp.]
MRRPVFILWLFLLSYPVFAQNQLPADTLVAQVGTKINGSTRDLAMLDIHLLTLKAHQSNPGLISEADELIIVKDGRLTVTCDGKTKVLGPGGVGLFSGNKITLGNPGSTPVNYFAFHFVSRRTEFPDSSNQTPPFLLDWTEMPVKITDKGESRQIFSQPTHYFQKIDMHATTLNEGQVSHLPHTHRNEEIILIRSGDVQMFIGGQYHKAKAGDIVFLTSGTPHALENKTKGRCEYFALQWQP